MTSWGNVFIRRTVTSVVFVWALSAASASANAILPRLTVTTASYTVNVTDTFYVNIDIEGVTDLYAYQFDFAFDSSILTFVSIAEGTFLSDGISPGGGTFFIDGTDPPSTVYGNSVVGQDLGVGGSGRLATATFRATTSGIASITLPNPLIDSNFLFIDSNFMPITFDPIESVYSASVRVNSVSSAVPDEPSAMILLVAALALATCRCCTRAS